MVLAGDFLSCCGYPAAEGKAIFYVEGQLGLRSIELPNMMPLKYRSRRLIKGPLDSLEHASGYSILI